jgi:hypothetical protein
LNPRKLFDAGPIANERLAVESFYGCSQFVFRFAGGVDGRRQAQRDGDSEKEAMWHIDRC